MSAQWSTKELSTTPLRLVRQQALISEIRRKGQRLILKEMAKPAIVGAAIIVGFLMQAAGIHLESVLLLVVPVISSFVVVALRDYFRSRKLREGKVQRSSEAIAELDFKERQRIDVKQEQFIEMVRDLHAQQTANMQSIIENQKAIIENQKEAMKLKDIELDKRSVQIAEMQKELLKTEAH